MDAAAEGEFPRTNGVLAMINLQAQIDGQKRRVMAQEMATVSCQAGLIELVALRGQVLGRISDCEWGEEKSEQLTREAPADAAAFLARARARGRFHCFTNALADLDEAQRLGMDSTLVNAERASVLQAIGRYEPAFAIYSEAAKDRADFASIGALATLHAERGEIDAAEQLFDRSRDRYRGVLPFPLAQLDFRQGLMWMEQGELDRALLWFKAAVRRLPAYAPAQGHMAEVEAALGEPEAAIARLLPLTTSSDDPDYAASLASILSASGRGEEAAEWRSKTAGRYDELMTRHPEAFADHAAEFWLDAGADPRRALQYAKINLDVRQTPRARALFARASFEVRSRGAGYV